MGWKGTLRSITAASNRYSRELEKRERAQAREEQRLEKQFIKKEKELEKLNMLLSAHEEVDEYETYINKIKSMHKNVLCSIDWEKIANSNPPQQPNPIIENEQFAKERYNKFKPNLLHKIFKRTDKIKAKLEQDILLAKKIDQEKTNENIKNFKKEYINWENNVEEANKVLNFDPEILEVIISKFTILDKLPELGTNINLNLNDNNELIIDIFLHGENIIPTQVKTLLKSGKVSIKDLPKTKYYELHQDYVCSAVLRVAREFFGLLPIKKIIVTAFDEILDKSTGHLTEQPILSVLFPKETINKLNFQAIDPSDSMNNFINNMCFKKTTGFSAIEVIKF